LTAILAVFLWKKGYEKMKEETKKNIEDFCSDFTIATICFFVLTSLNGKCTSAMHKEANQKLEKPQQTQPVKQKMVYVAKQKTR